jgi:hypothetical protein
MRLLQDLKRLWQDPNVTRGTKALHLQAGLDYIQWQLWVYSAFFCFGGGEEQAEVLAELGDGAVVRIDGAVGAGEHDAAFHGDEDECGEGVDVSAAGQG